MTVLPADVRAANDCCDIVHTPVVEDYLKAIFALTTEDAGLRSAVLASHLGVSAPTVSAMLRRLEVNGLVRRSQARPIELTDHGRRHALGVVRRHRLLELFLTEVLAVPWDEVHDEAEILEHAISPRLEERIDALLGHPTHDPHGDPIPPASGQHIEIWATPLAAASDGDRFVVERVSDRDSDLLRHLGELGIQPGTALTVGERSPFGGPLWVEVDGQRQPLSPGVVQAVHGQLVR